MFLSNNGSVKLIDREGRRKHAYQDTKGIWTIGVGHTGPEVCRGLVWNDAKIEAAFKEDVQWAVDAVNEVKVPLNQNMFDALVSFTFNVGKYAFLQSTMKKLLDKGLYADAAKEFDKWHKPSEIISRRDGEKAQFLTPV
jgi:lysozyme